MRHALIFLLDTPTMTARSSDGHGDDADKDAFPTLRKFCLMQREIVEPLLVFCCHGIRVKDTRCCSMILRLFVSLVPEFGKTPNATHSRHDVPQEIASGIREYISTEVLQACITSLHDPYFVELQKELAALIASIIVYYSPITATPRNVISSLPNVNPADLERLAVYTSKPGAHTRQQRAIVMDMLKNLKAVSVSEMGKLPKDNSYANSNRAKKVSRTKMAETFMSESTPSGPGPTRAGEINGAGGDAPDALEGISNLFDA